MKGICQGTNPVLGSFAGYRKKTISSSHDRFVLGLEACCPKLQLTASYKGRFSIKS